MIKKFFLSLPLLLTIYLSAETTGELHIRDLADGTVIVVDHEVFEYGGENPLELPLGVRRVFLWKRGLAPVSYEITVKDDDSAYITHTKKMGRGRKAFIWGVLSAGAFGYSLYVYNEEVANREEWEDDPGFNSFTAVGAILALPALIHFKGYLGELFDYRTEKAGRP